MLTFLAVIAVQYIIPTSRFVVMVFPSDVQPCDLDFEERGGGVNQVTVYHGHLNGELKCTLS